MEAPGKQPCGVKEVGTVAPTHEGVPITRAVMHAGHNRLLDMEQSGVTFGFRS
jgi:hypothetical protein